jgi:hypothetical protein
MNTYDTRQLNEAELITTYGNKNGLVMINDPTPMQGFGFLILENDIIVFKSDTYEAVKKVTFWQKINLESHENVFSYTYRMTNYLAVYDKQYIAFFMISGGSDPDRDYIKLDLELGENILKICYIPNDVRC